MNGDACQMMIDGFTWSRPCGATPTVGGNGLYRYCEAHFAMVAAAGATTLVRDLPAVGVDVDRRGDVVMVAKIDPREPRALYDAAGRQIGEVTIDGDTGGDRRRARRVRPAHGDAGVARPRGRREPAGRRSAAIGACVCGHGSDAHNAKGWCTAAGCGCGRVRPAPAPPAGPPPFEPVSDARLREIAHGVDVVPSPWPDGSGTPLEVEMGAMAAELLSARNALRYHEARPRMRTAATEPIAGAVPVFDKQEGRDRGDISDVVAACDPASLVTIKDIALIDEPPGISVGFLLHAAAVKAIKERAAARLDPEPGTRVRVTVGNFQGFIGEVQPREDDQPPGWSRVRRDAHPRETRLFESKHMEPVP